MKPCFGWVAPPSASLTPHDLPEENLSAQRFNAEVWLCLGKIVLLRCCSFKYQFSLLKFFGRNEKIVEKVYVWTSMEM